MKRVTYITESFLAIAYVTDIGLLAGVDPLVDLERRALMEPLRTSFLRANERPVI